MKTLTRMAAAITTAAFILGTVACGGATDAPKDASEAGDDAAPKKGLEKFEGNRMEAAEEDE